MELTHGIKRLLRTAAPAVSSTRMLLAFYQWMVGRRGQAAEEMEYVQIQERELLKDLWNRYGMYRSVYQVYDDYLDNDMMVTSQMTGTLKERLASCQSLLRLNRPLIRKGAWDAYNGLLKAYNHLVEVVMQEMCEPEGMNAFLRDNHNDIYGSEALLIELLRG